jgi:hypothetical protein
LVADVEAESPDDLVLERVDPGRERSPAAHHQLGGPPGTVDVVLNDLERSGLLESVAALRGRLI